MTIQASLEGQFTGLESAISRSGVLNESVSSWSVGDHIEHACLAAGGLAVALCSGRSPAFSGGQSDWKEHVLIEGTIPRGTIKAPAAAQPKTGLTAAQLHTMVRKTRERLVKASEVDSVRTANHPILGPMTRDEVLRFVEVHTRHHREIIADILTG